MNWKMTAMLCWFWATNTIQVRQAGLDKLSGYLSRAASEVYFNTLFRSRRAASSRDPYVGMLVDAYGPDVAIKRNLVIEPELDERFEPTRNYVFHLGAGPQSGLAVENNLVFPTCAAAGLAVVDHDSGDRIRKSIQGTRSR